MTDFDGILAQFGVDLLDEIGTDAVFVPKAGSPISCRAFLDWEDDFQVGGYDSGGNEKLLTIRFLESEVGRRADVGEIFIIDGTHYKVQSELEAGNKDDVCKVVVK